MPIAVEICMVEIHTIDTNRNYILCVMIKCSDWRRTNQLPVPSVNGWLAYPLYASMEKYPRGQRGPPAKGLGGLNRARVRIPPSPPIRYSSSRQDKSRKNLQYIINEVSKC